MSYCRSGEMPECDSLYVYDSGEGIVFHVDTDHIVLPDQAFNQIACQLLASISDEHLLKAVLYAKEHEGKHRWQHAIERSKLGRFFEEIAKGATEPGSKTEADEVAK